MAYTKARYVELPTYVVHIGLLYALLLTSGLVLAWVTIYRHEQSIAELRQMLNTREDKPQSQHTSQAAAVYTSGEREMLLEQTKEEEMRESGPRERRGKEKKNKNKKDSVGECGKVKCVGEKGDTGAKGRKGRRGRSGEQGKLGLPGPPGTPGFPGAPGYSGQRGPTGDKGDKGESGGDGNVGNPGEKGDKGDAGSPGIKGSQGDKGEAGETIMYSESAHIVGTGDLVPSAPAPGDVYTITSWKKQHRSGEMRYDDNGHLTVNTDGVYFVYSQMFYYDRNNTYTGFSVYINNKRILKAIYSIVDFHKPYHTQFISGVFRINKGQRIWIGTRIKRKYFFNESSAFFGAFMLHP